MAQLKIDGGADEKDIDEKSFHCLVQSLGSVGFNEISSFSGTYQKGDVFAVMSDGVDFLNKKM